MDPRGLQEQPPRWQALPEQRRLSQVPWVRLDPQEQTLPLQVPLVLRGLQGLPALKGLQGPLVRQDPWDRLGPQVLLGVMAATVYKAFLEQ